MKSSEHPFGVGKGAITSMYGYNTLCQLISKTVKQGDTGVYTRSYTYDRIMADSGCNWIGMRLMRRGAGWRRSAARQRRMFQQYYGIS